MKARLFSADRNLEGGLFDNGVAIRSDGRELTRRNVEAQGLSLSGRQRDALEANQRTDGIILRCSLVLRIKLDHFFACLGAGIGNLNRDPDWLAGHQLL